MLSKEGIGEWVRFKLDQSIDHILVDEGQDTSPEQWAIIEPLFEEKRRPDGRGRPWRDARAVTARSAIHGSLLDGGRL